MTSYEYLNLLASYGGLGLLFYGIRVMAKGAEMRAADSERKHTETMTDSGRKHTETMTDSGRRHNEFMIESERRHNETMVSLSQSHDALRELIEEQAESRMALRELIERTR